MYDEDTGEEIRCPHCGSDEDCPHLLVVFDRAFGECLGGYAFERNEEFGEVIQEAFLKLLERGDPEKYSWSDPEIAGLWNDVVDEHTAPDDEELSLEDFLFGGVQEYIWLDDRAFFSLLSDTLHTRHDRICAKSGNTPGSSSAIDMFYVLDPEKAFETALADLRLRLQSALIEVSAEG